MSGNFAIENTRRSGFPRSAEQVAVKILDSTVVELEAVQTISSKDVTEGDAIPFRVARPLIVDCVTVIAAGTVAMGVITEAEESDRYGQPGKIAWDVKELIAVDGTAIPLQLSVRLSASEHSRTDEREMAAASLMFPVASLALLLFATRGENAVIRSGQRFRAFVRGDIEVWASPSRE
jgi:hypothetical protein